MSTIPSQHGSPISTDAVVPAVSKNPDLDPFAFPRSTDETVRSSRVLIIDDEESVIRHMELHLDRSGFSNTRGVTDSTKAIETIKSWQPSLVLLDLRMQPINGLAILEELRTDEATKNIAVIVVSSAVDEVTTVTALNLGATDFLSKPVRAAELIARTRNALSEKAFRDLSAAHQQKLESDLLSDPLTGIANRRAFDYELKRRLIEWNRYRTPMGLAMIDLDRFKQVNDWYGHHFGDTALQTVARAVVASTRSMDLVARYGGEELAVIMPSTTAHEVREVSQRIRKSVEALQVTCGSKLIGLTVSVGAANAMTADDANLLIKRADTALYAAKRNGRNRVYYHDGTVNRLASAICPTNPSPAVIRPNGSNQAASTTIAIVDDEPTTIMLVKKYLREAGYQNFIEITDETQAVATIESENPDLVMLDIHMPKICGLEVLEQLRNGSAAASVPVLIFTSDRKSEAKVNALNLGANDFIQKPLDPSELLARVRNTILAKARLDDLADHSSRLEHEVQIRTTELAASRREAIQCLARAAELKDDQTGQHVLRVGRYARIIAQALDFSIERAEWIELAAQLHDVGKIGIPDSLLRKKGPLNDAEYELIKTHCREGNRIIRDQPLITDPSINSHTQLGMEVFDDCNSPIMRMAAVIACTHHEKWDGSGYPNGLSGTGIPIEGRIAAVADVFDALSTERPYKLAFPLDECFRILEEGRGTHFDPDILDAFLKRKSEIIQTFFDYSDC